MKLVFEIIGWWVAGAITLGPCLTWLFFWGDRQDAASQTNLGQGEFE